MEAEIIKHVHLHREVEPKNLDTPVETDKTGETVETVPFIRSCTKPKPVWTQILPQSVSNNIDYMDLGEQSDMDKSPTPKWKRYYRLIYYQITKCMTIM